MKREQWIDFLATLGFVATWAVTAVVTMMLVASFCGCASYSARDAASAEYTAAYHALNDRAETAADNRCLGAIERAWRRAWDSRREEALLRWLDADGWRDLPACRGATFGGAP